MIRHATLRIIAALPGDESLAAADRLRLRLHAPGFTPVGAPQ